VIEKYNDDGEPGSTAGIPMLNVLKMQEIENVIAVVVRYFGGTLLGTGGLVRAYSHAVIQTLEQTDIIVLEYSWRLRITFDYSYYSNFQNKCLRYFIKILNPEFGEQIIIDAWIPQNQLEKLISALDNITDRTAVVEYINQDFIAGKDDR
jgi:putative IMPACT (imprinted ancient) family translation regulator